MPPIPLRSESLAFELPAVGFPKRAELALLETPERVQR